MQGGLDVLKFDKNFTDFCVSYFNLRGISSPKSPVETGVATTTLFLQSRISSILRLFKFGYSVISRKATVFVGPAEYFFVDNGSFKFSSQFEV